MLTPGEEIEVTAAGVWVEGQHTNNATTTVLWCPAPNGNPGPTSNATSFVDDSLGDDLCGPVTDSDPANFWGFVPQEGDDDDSDTDTDTDTDSEADSDTDTDGDIIIIEVDDTPLGPVVIIEDPAPLADAPQTGENSNVAHLMGMMLLSAAGLVAVTRKR